MDPYKVVVIVDRSFAQQLSTLDRDAPIWIVRTERNRSVADRLWNEDKRWQITVFLDAEGMTPEQVLAATLETIDLHHGRFSHRPPYTQLEIRGAQPDDAVKAALAEYGFNDFTSGANGFLATRPALPKPSF
jgi:hypothetical protein